MEAFDNLSLVDPDIHHFNIDMDFQSYTIDLFNKDLNISPNSLAFTTTMLAVLCLLVEWTSM